jgi:alpha-tubulin suppressor-like RCC1 family protein
VTSDGGLLCWGKNDAGQLGPGAAGLLRSVRPVAVPLSGVTAVAAGGQHTCALLGSGATATVSCWGANGSGQLGGGGTSATSAIVSNVLTGATALALGGRHSCAVVGSGAAVWCWGANDLGQLGTGDFTSHAAPIATQVTAGVTSLSAAGDDSCVVTSGKAMCWGLDLEGQTGANDQVVPRQPKATPVQVPLSSSALKVVAGRKHGCGNSTGGGTPLSCWGSGGEGELGNGLTITPQLTPVQASQIDGTKLASVFAAGEAFTCSAVAGVEGMRCAGRNDQAQCGLAPPGSAVGGVYVSFGGTVLAASAGRAFTCALVDQGGQLVVMCWGANAEGQLGRATPASAPSQTPDLVGK